MVVGSTWIANTPGLERYPTKLNQFDGGKSVFRAGLPSPKRSFGFAQAGAA